MQTKIYQNTPSNLRQNSRLSQTDKSGEPGSKESSANSSVEPAEYMARMKKLRLEVILSTRENIQKQAKVSASINDLFLESPVEGHAAMIEGLTPEEAAELVSEDGYYGIVKTAERLADFVLKGGGDDPARLRAGREGITRGFQEAEKAWGGNLPEISHKTLEKALAMIDEHIRELGGSVVETSA